MLYTPRSAREESSCLSDSSNRAPRVLIIPLHEVLIECAWSALSVAERKALAIAFSHVRALSLVDDDGGELSVIRGYAPKTKRVGMITFGPAIPVNYHQMLH